MSSHQPAARAQGGLGRPGSSPSGAASWSSRSAAGSSWSGRSRPRPTPGSRSSRRPCSAARPGTFAIAGKPRSPTGSRSRASRAWPVGRRPNTSAGPIQRKARVAEARRRDRRPAVPADQRERECERIRRNNRLSIGGDSGGSTTSSSTRTSPSDPARGLEAGADPPLSPADARGRVDRVRVLPRARQGDGPPGPRPPRVPDPARRRRRPPPDRRPGLRAGRPRPGNARRRAGASARARLAPAPPEGLESPQAGARRRPPDDHPQRRPDLRKAHRADQRPDLRPVPLRRRGRGPGPGRELRGRWPKALPDGEG